jgi:hypothetical protein
LIWGEHVTQLLSKQLNNEKQKKKKNWNLNFKPAKTIINLNKMLFDNLINNQHTTFSDYIFDGILRVSIIENNVYGKHVLILLPTVNVINGVKSNILMEICHA